MVDGLGFPKLAAKQGKDQTEYPEDNRDDALPGNMLRLSNLELVPPVANVTIDPCYCSHGFSSALTQIETPHLNYIFACFIWRHADAAE